MNKRQIVSERPVKKQQTSTTQVERLSVHYITIASYMY